ncbi:hypothetical protein N9A38_01470 [Gammaproteobacteria bacterium]|nr:hypothetical protein [Gammaproteobacteria bacterium]
MLCRISFFCLLIFAHSNVKKLPPRFVKPCIRPRENKPIFILLLLLLNIIFLNFDKLMIEKNIIVNDVSKIKSILFSYLSKIDKAKINEGIQYNRTLLLNFESTSLLYIICRRLIVIEKGSKILRTLKKL